MELLILYLSFGVACATSSMCFLVNHASGQPYQNGTLLELSSTLWLESSVEWYNSNDILSIHARVKLEFTGTSNSYFALNLYPCTDRAWFVRIAKGQGWGPLVEVLYYAGAGTQNFFNNAADVLFIEDGQFHDLLAVIDRVSTDSLLFNVSIDSTQYISFLFTDGMNDNQGVAVLDSHVMAVNEFGYSRTISIDGGAVNAYVQSFSVSGQPVNTNRFSACSNLETQSGQAPVNPQSVSPCPLTATDFPTLHPISTKPTASSPNPTSNPTSPTTMNPTANSIASPSPTASSRNPAPNPATPTTMNHTANPNPSPTLKADQDESTTTFSSDGEGNADNTYSTEQKEGEGKGNDSGNNIDDIASGSFATTMMYTFIGVSVCLCAILTFIAWLYLKKRQEAKSVPQNMAASEFEDRGNANDVKEEADQTEQQELREQIPTSLELQMRATQQAMIIAGRGDAGAQRQSLSDGMYVDKKRGSDVITETAAGGNILQYTDEGVDDNVRANKHKIQSENTPRSDTPQTRTKGDSIAEV